MLVDATFRHLYAWMDDAPERGVQGRRQHGCGPEEPTPARAGRVRRVLWLVSISRACRVAGATFPGSVAAQLPKLDGAATVAHGIRLSVAVTHVLVGLICSTPGEAMMGVWMCSCWSLLTAPTKIGPQ